LLTSGVPDTDSAYAHLLAGISFRPVFIIGDHRSGTTLLYQILAATGSFHYLSAYHVISYGSIVRNHLEYRVEDSKRELVRRFAALGLSNRVFDGTRVHPDLPEEYGFVLEDNPRPRLQPRNMERFQEMCRKLRLIGGQDKPLLLKNPWDVENFEFVFRTFPESRFLFIHRHPLAVINSQLRAIRSSLMDRNEYVALIAPWYRRAHGSIWQRGAMQIAFSPSLPFWNQIVSRHVRRAGQYFLKHISQLPPDRYFCLRYEDLCSTPRSIITAVLQFLHIEAENDVNYEAWIAMRESALLPEIARVKDQLLRSFQPILSYNGYIDN
jgi:hypothetical protein